MGLIIYHKGGRKMKKNILIVGGGPEITICYDLINNSTEYNFLFSIRNSYDVSRVVCRNN